MLGPQGQEVVNPLIPEIRHHRMTLASLLKQLKLPDDAAAAGGNPRSVQARNAASSWWQKPAGRWDA